MAVNYSTLWKEKVYFTDLLSVNTTMDAKSSCGVKTITVYRGDMLPFSRVLLPELREIYAHFFYI